MTEGLGRSPTSKNNPTQERKSSPEEPEVDNEFLEQENTKCTSTYHPSHGSHKPDQETRKNLKWNQKGRSEKNKHNRVMELLNGRPSLVKISMNTFEIRY